jgi:hypothetical protein
MLLGVFALAVSFVSDWTTSSPGGCSELAEVSSGCMAALAATELPASIRPASPATALPLAVVKPLNNAIASPFTGVCRAYRCLYLV